MSERYTRIYSLPAEVYAEGAPVVVSAGTVLMDNVENSALAQIKFYNVSQGRLASIEVVITPKDVDGNVIGDDVSHVYTELDAAPDAYFGQKSPISLPEGTASYDVRVDRAEFTDGGEWNSSGAQWKMIPAPRALDSLGDPELVKQFGIACDVGGTYLPENLGGLWRCTCGALCKEHEEICSACCRERDTLLAITLDGLTNAKNARVAAEKAAAKKKKGGIIAIIAVAAVVLLAVAAVIAIIVTKPSRVMDKAREYAAAGDYVTAVAVLDELDRPDKTGVLRSLYIATMEDEIATAIDDGEYAQAVALIDKYTTLDNAEENMALVQELCPHNYEETERLDNTCTVDGFLVETCADCRFVRRTEFIAPGHDHVSELTVEQTCTNEGTLVYTCSVCGDTYDETLAMLPHNYESTVTLEPTCTAEGNLRSTCVDCGKVVDEAIEMLPHTNQVLTIKYATCTSTGLKQDTCMVCGHVSDEEVVAMLPHSNAENITKAATCTEKGVKEFRCTVCSALDHTEEIAMLPHSYANVVTKAATCTADGSQQEQCTVCGHVNSTSVIKMLGHDHVKSTVVKVSCTANGTDRYTCSRCGDTYDETVKATGHDWADATCTTAKKCNNCGRLEGVALGHYWNRKYSWDDTKCTRCNEIFKESDAAILITGTFPVVYDNFNYDDELESQAFFTGSYTTVEVSGTYNGRVELDADVTIVGYTTMDYFYDRFKACLYDANGTLVDSYSFSISQSTPGQFSKTVYFYDLLDRNIYYLRILLA